MTNQPTDLLSNFFQQMRSGRMSLITLMQNLPSTKLPSIPEITYNDEGRYMRLASSTNLVEASIQREIDDGSANLCNKQSAISVFPSSFIETKMSSLSLEERCQSVAQAFDLSTTDVRKQYELALKNRLEIPPILMRRILIDAIAVLRIMIDELNQETDKNQTKLTRISKRLTELKAYSDLFDRHC